jgi:hypothetical protein
MSPPEYIRAGRDSLQSITILSNTIHHVEHRVLRQLAVRTCLNIVLLAPSSSWSRRHPTYNLSPREEEHTLPRQEER